jgi:4-amino-4-deoxy-L-arabinose transferase-like glycosyltransferase
VSAGRAFWLRLLGVALAVRVLFSLLLVWGWPLTSDGSGYSGQAEGFLRDFPGAGQYYWPPGTSYVLAAVYEVLGAGRVSARLTMIALSVATVAATVLLARRVLDDERAARTAGWVMALLPSAVFMPSQPFSFDVTMLGVTLAVLGALAAYDRGQARWLVGGGLALGLAAVARPGSVSILAALVPIGVVAAVRLWRAGERVRVRALALGAVGGAIGLGAIVAVPLVHHHDIGAGWTVSTNNEGNLLLGNNPYTPDYKTWHLGQHDFDEFGEPARSYLNTHFFNNGGTREQREAMRDDALDYMTGHPARTALRTVNRVRAFWGFDYTYSNGLRADWGEPPLPVAAAAGGLEVGGWLLFGALALAGFFLGRALFRPSRAMLLIAVVLAYEIPHAIAFAGGRWHLPVLALLAPFAAAGVVALGRSPRDVVARVRASRPLLVAIALFLLVQLEYAYFLVTTEV